MAKKQDRTRRLFGAMGPYDIAYRIPPKMIAEKITEPGGGTVEMMKRAPAGIRSKRMVFQKATSLEWNKYGIIKRAKVPNPQRDDTLPSHILLISPDDEEYDLKVQAIMDSPDYQMRKIWDLDDVRRERWEGERAGKDLERMSAFTAYARVFGVEEIEAQRRCDREMLLLDEIYTRCKAEQDRQNKEAVEQPEAVGAAAG